MRAEEFSPELFASLDQRLDLAIVDLLWWATTLSAGRATT
jgi:hypothetical protein